jgi:hypothetical protein
MIYDTVKAFEEIKEKYNLVHNESLTLCGVKIDDWTFSDALNAKGFVIEYKLGFRFAEKCLYDSKYDFIKFVGIVFVEPSNYDSKIRKLREMFDKAQFDMKQYRIEKRIKKLDGDFE